MSGNIDLIIFWKKLNDIFLDIKGEKSFTLPSVIPLPLSNDVLQEIIDKAKDWALMHGACMRSKTNFSKDSLQFAPFVLLPSAFPRVEFNKAVEIQTILNELMHKVAHNADFLRDCLKETIQVDDFTSRLYQIFDLVQKEGMTQVFLYFCYCLIIMFTHVHCFILLQTYLNLILITTKILYLDKIFNNI